MNTYLFRLLRQHTTGPVHWLKCYPAYLAGEAEEFSRVLAQLGLVRGRAKGAAGQLATADYGEVLQLVASGYGKVRPGARDVAEEGGAE